MPGGSGGSGGPLLPLIAWPGTTWGASLPLGGGGGGRPSYACGDCVCAAVLEISCGRGGTGGGVGVAAAGCCGVDLGCCRAITGGSFANMSHNIARKSNSDDFCETISNRVVHDHLVRHCENVHSRPKTQAISPSMDGICALVDRHAGPA